MLGSFALPARRHELRGTFLDPIRFSEGRRREQVRGFGPVRARTDAAWRRRLPALRRDFREPERALRRCEPEPGAV